MAERLLAGALLLAQLAAIGWFLKGDIAGWRPFRGLGGELARRRRYWRWAVKDVLAFGLPALLGLLLLGQIGALTRVPAALAPAEEFLPAIGADGLRTLLPSVALGFLGGTVLVVLVTRLRKERKPPPTLGDVSRLTPSGPHELFAGTVLSAVAGVTEELAFRLFLPLLLALLTGSAVIGFAAATLLFGAMHLYQGWVGVLATTLVGAALAAVYLMTGLLWLAMLFHVAIDLNGLVLRPVLTGAWKR